MAHFGGNTITWLGHATLHIQTVNGTSILVDPWLAGNPSSPKGYKLPKKIDLLLLTHGHDDHFHDAVSIAKKYKPKVVGVYELTSYMLSKGVKDVQPMNYGGGFHFQDLRISMVEAKHSSSIVDGGAAIYAGVACGYVVAAQGGPTMYLAGDTSLFGDMRLLKEMYAPEVGVLPIGDNFTMGPKHAAKAAEFLGIKTLLPIHYGTFPALTGTPDELRTYLSGSKVTVVAPKPGEAVL